MGIYIHRQIYTGAFLNHAHISATTFIPLPEEINDMSYGNFLGKKPY